ncbi:uncharacterized protein LOC143447129 [Clavelina lepadiformis]|uniref:uncharacterized protein LOC143447129 n=1 Tax=Clavelina lepadiformis TaxID=159417 RepID=UPI004042410E
MWRKTAILLCVVLTSTVQAEDSCFVDDGLSNIARESSSIVNRIENWYEYIYDGRTSPVGYIQDGGNDMFDRGNTISIFENHTATVETDLEYNRLYSFESFEFNSIVNHPFVALLWVKNENLQRRSYRLEVSGNAGSDASGSITTFSGNITLGLYSLQYEVFQISGAGDPSICEVYFLVTSEQNWNSTAPLTFEPSFGSSTDELENSVFITGTPRNVLLGYTLLSRLNGSLISESEIRNASIPVLMALRNVGIRPSCQEQQRGSCYVTDGLNMLAQNSSAIVSSIQDWHYYAYDGEISPEGFIRDGNKDVFDGGNKLSIIHDANGTFDGNVAYNQLYRFEDIEFNSFTGYPFTALMWIKNSRMSKTYGLKVSGNAGSDGYGFVSTYSGNFTTGSFVLQYEVFQISNATDPSICEVYFVLSSDAAWESIPPKIFTADFSASTTYATDNRVYVSNVTGSILMGYMLFSSQRGRKIPENEIRSALTRVSGILQNVSYDLYNCLYESTTPPSTTPHPSSCGVSTIFTSTSGQLTSPGYPGDYFNRANCSWTISTYPGQILNVTFRVFALENGDGNVCIYDKLTIFDGSRQETYCGDDKPETFISQNNTILIQFITDGSIVDRGFRLKWSSQVPSTPTTPPAIPTSDPYTPTTPSGTNTSGTCFVLSGASYFHSYRPLITSLPYWYSYDYDGLPSAKPSVILDGGLDMYDHGNRITLYKNGLAVVPVVYDELYRAKDFEFVSDKKGHPFFALLWVKNPYYERINYTIQVEGDAGADGRGSALNFSDRFENVNFTMEYKVFQVADTEDPTICEVYFLLSNYNWNSIKPDNFTASFGSETNHLNNSVTISGRPRRVLLGYTLLSKTSGRRFTELEISMLMRTVVQSLLNVHPLYDCPYDSTTPQPTTPQPPSCGEPTLLSLSSGQLFSPGYPGNYSDGISCNWTISTSPGKVWNVTFLEFALEHHSNCSYDNLVIFDGSEQRTYCGDAKQESFISQGNTIFIQFNTDGSVVNRGFLLEFFSQDQDSLPLSCPYFNRTKASERQSDWLCRYIRWRIEFMTKWQPAYKTWREKVRIPGTIPFNQCLNLNVVCRNSNQFRSYQDDYGCTIPFCQDGYYSGGPGIGDWVRDMDRWELFQNLWQESVSYEGICEG